MLVAHGRRLSPTSPGPWVVVPVSIAVLAASTFAISSVGALAPKLEHAFSFSKADIGLVTSVVFLGAALGSWPAGRLTDRVDPARVLFASMLLFTAAVGLFAVAPDRTVLLLAAALAGLAYGGLNPPTNVVVAGQLSRRLGFFLSLKQSGVPLGGLLAGLVLPSVAIAYSWRVAVVVACAVCAAVTAVTPLLRNARTIDPAPHRRGRETTRREVRALSVFGFVMAGSQWVFLTYLVLFLTDHFHFGLALAGVALALAQALGACARLAWGWLSDVSPNRLAVLLGMAGLQVVALELLAVVPDTALAWPLIGLAGVTIVGWNGAFYGLVAETAGPGNVGQVSGQALVWIFAGSVALPPALGAIADALGSWSPLWALCGGVVAVGAGVLGLGLRQLEPPAEASVVAGSGR